MKILVPIDGSQNALLAVKYAAHMASLEPNLKITLMYVITFEPSSLREATFIERTSRCEAEEALRQAEEIIKNTSSVITDRYIARGFNAADQILDYAENECFDGIVMGSRGLSNLQRFFIGSVSSHVSQHSPCTVTLVK